MRIFLMVLLAASLLNGGTVAIKSGTPLGGHTVIRVMPNCAAAASDTCGPIDLEYAKYFSVSFDGSRVAYKDTAIVDSGFVLKIFGSTEKNKTRLCIMNSADSIVNFFGSTGSKIDKRRSMVKGLSLDLKQYIYAIFTRTDTNADTLDFKSALGVRDSSIINFEIWKERP